MQNYDRYKQLRYDNTKYHHKIIAIILKTIYIAKLKSKQIFTSKNIYRKELSMLMFKIIFLRIYKHDLDNKQQAN